MTAPDQYCINVKKPLSIRRRPHMTQSGHRRARRRDRISAVQRSLRLMVPYRGGARDELAAPPLIQNGSDLTQGSADRPPGHAKHVAGPAVRAAGAMVGVSGACTPQRMGG